MSHLDTAYKLGAMRALHDFQTEVEKQAWQPGSTVPGAPSSVPVGSPTEAVRGSVASGLGTSTRQALQGAKLPVSQAAPKPPAAAPAPPALARR